MCALAAYESGPAGPRMDILFPWSSKTLCSTSKERSVFIDPKCRELIKDLRQVRWKRDSAGNPIGTLDKSDPQRTHLTDALSYLVASEFGLRGRAGEMPYSIR
jgi:hypothetical protein